MAKVILFRSCDPDRQDRSPYFQSGLLDGLHDRRRLEHNPPLEVRGMDPQMSGVLTGITSTGNLTLTWAQNSSSGTPTVLLAGSYLELQRIV